MIKLVWNSPSPVILCFLQHTQWFLNRLFLCQVFIACSWKNNFCYWSAFFWGFCFINSIHYPLSLYPINYKPQFTWKCITMKSLHSMCVTRAAYTAASFDVGVIGSHSLLTTVLSSLQNDLKPLTSTWWPHYRTAALCNLTAIIGCFSDKTKLRVDMEVWQQVVEP